ncbi:MAG: hypothetical protein KDD84_00960 [Caldilineaceae bacterium]|nr:hypothetical protein [Caldilineaceae bacterium]
MPWLVAVLLFLLAAVPVAANGVPVEIFLDHLPFKTTWDPAVNARGMAVVAANDESVRVMAQNLPQPPAGQVYYAWLEQAEGGFLAVGALNYLNDGTASIDQHMPELPHSEHFSWVLVSLEDIRYVGSAPSIDVALAGRLPNAMALPPTAGESPSLLPVTGAEGAASHNWLGLPALWVLILLFALTTTLLVARRMQFAPSAIRRRQRSEK